MTRREKRERVFQILFKLEFNSIDEMDEQIAFSMEGIEKIKDSEKDYIAGKVKNVIANLDAIDKTISEVSSGWKLERIGKAELAILRLALYEMKYDDDIPFNVAVSEAIELSKIYCGDEAKSFINALLSKVDK